MKEQNTLFSAFVLGSLIALGLSSAGYFTGSALEKMKRAERYVTVKGLAEREVKADRAKLVLTFSNTGDNIAQLYAKGEEDHKRIVDFLHSQKIENDEITLSPAQVVDKFASEYNNQAPREEARYVLNMEVVVVSTDVDKISTLSQKIGSLVKEGIVLTNKHGNYAPHYYFTKLNDLRPEMIADSIKSARVGAEQFAAIAETKLGTIRSARQGPFQISSALSMSDNNGYDYEEKQSMMKKIRVVSSVDFFLE